ncbi:MAG: 1,4-dihydroxy-6-naphthoate synthase [Trueperaceae bacterium]
MNAPLRLGFSPCPNDAFVFHALVHGLVAPDLRWEVVMDDVEALNERVRRGQLDVAKISVHAYAHVADRYALLPSGGALGYGVGPLLVARDPELDLTRATVATPGGRTTANLLLDLFAPNGAQRTAMRYDRIVPAVVAGEVDAGLIIHESRFTYGDHGLHAVQDLGAWWEARTGRPIPLGAVAIRRDLPAERIARVAAAVRASVEAAWADPEASEAYQARHAQEMDPAVRRRHVETYVNDFTRDVGCEGREAVRTLFAQAEARGLFPAPVHDTFVPHGVRAPTP